MRIAFNDPKKYPKEPFMEKSRKRKLKKAMTPEQMEAIMKKNTLILGGKVQNGTDS